MSNFDIRPAKEAVEVTLADSDMARTARALYVGTTGNVKVTTVGGSAVTFKNVPAGGVILAEVKRVWLTGTTAADIVAYL